MAIDTLNPNPETQPTNGNRLKGFFTKLGWRKSTTPPQPEQSPWAPKSREQMTPAEREAADQHQANMDRSKTLEAERIADRVEKQYSDPKSPYNAATRSAEATKEAAVNEVLNPQGSIEQASNLTVKARERQDFGNQMVENTFTSGKNGATKQDVMDELHGRAIAEDAARASGDFVEPTATGRVTPPPLEAPPTVHDAAQSYVEGRQKGFPIAGEHNDATDHIPVQPKS